MGSTHALRTGAQRVVAKICDETIYWVAALWLGWVALISLETCRSLVMVKKTITCGQMPQPS
jgi:hypothetical protein